MNLVKVPEYYMRTCPISFVGLSMLPLFPSLTAATAEHMPNKSNIAQERRVTICLGFDRKNGGRGLDLLSVRHSSVAYLSQIRGILPAPATKAQSRVSWNQGCWSQGRVSFSDWHGRGAPFVVFPGKYERSI